MVTRLNDFLWVPKPYGNETEQLFEGSAIHLGRFSHIYTYSDQHDTSFCGHRVAIVGVISLELLILDDLFVFLLPGDNRSGILKI
jgi:hypothetical protein